MFLPRQIEETNFIRVSTPGADADPNSGTPLAITSTRVVRFNGQAPGGNSLFASVQGGTSLTAMGWVWDVASSLWIRATALATLTTATGPAVIFTFGPVGTNIAKYAYLQAVTNTGSVTDLFYGKY